MSKTRQHTSYKDEAVSQHSDTASLCYIMLLSGSVVHLHALELAEEIEGQLDAVREVDFIFRR